VCTSVDAPPPTLNRGQAARSLRYVVYSTQEAGTRSPYACEDGVVRVARTHASTAAYRAYESTQLFTGAASAPSSAS